MALSSLAPSFSPEQHQTYLDRLNKALEDPRNRNIALTGRYGAGKSSVLDQFEQTHKSKGRWPKPRVLRLAISSLSPNDEGASLTNLIQKEIVKQLIYNARPSTLDRSQFRPAELGRWKAAGQVAGLLVCVGMFLVLMGWLPTPAIAGSGEPWEQRAAVWVALVAVLLLAGTTLRLLMHQRFFASEFSAAGAKVKLSEKKLTYFDEYLDLIVTFFDSEKIDVVIFEDLDRFNDPYIFEALRELNTLLNGRGRGKKRSGPLRFVYAVRDSLFERIGSKPKADAAPDTAGGTHPATRSTAESTAGPAVRERVDAASVETLRANRTKFFEVVIPVVPFISHRNARDLLVDMLEGAGITGVERGLVDLVARHCTDMRLLRNMRNEYLVFAERLLHGEKRAPGLTPTKLFALVAYKNFHLEDFENIARRSSALDTLYDDRRTVVRHCVAAREQEIRDIRSSVTRPGSVASLAHQSGTRLNALGHALIEHNNWNNWHLSYLVDSTPYTEQEALTASFWEKVVETAAVSLRASNNPRSNGGQSLFELPQHRLEALFPEVAEGRWEERNEAAAREQVDRLSAEINFLRGADFEDLAGRDEYAMPKPTLRDTSTEPMTTADDAPAVPFSTRLKEALGSELARDLIRGGFIDQNYSVYAAQFYGGFAGVDVHRFLIQAEQPNTPEIDFKFDSENSVEQLLKEASGDFTKSVSAFNTDVLDWLLSHDDPGARDVVTHVMRIFETSDDAREVLATHLTSGSERLRLAALLASEEWRPTFTHLASGPNVPEDLRAELVDAALRATRPTNVSNYDTSIEVANFLLGHYQQMTAFTEPQSNQVATAVVALLSRAGVRLPDLDGLDDRVREQVVEANQYELTAHNLRLATGLKGPVDLDHLRAASPGAVYGFCLRELETYLAAVADDDATKYAINAAETLVDVLGTEASADWSSAQQATLFGATSAAAALRDILAVPSTTWRTLAAAGLFQATLGNVGAYLVETEEVDTGLGALLTAAGTVDPDPEPPVETDESEETPAPADARKVALAVLNAREAIPSTEDRVQLASSLELDAPLGATEVAAEKSDLFARLLQAGLVADDQATFDHLATGGWPAVRAAIVTSGQVRTVLTQAHISGMVENVLDNLQTAEKVGGRILEDLDSFVAADDRTAWAAVGKYAVRTRQALAWPHLQQVAGHGAGSAPLTMQLLVLAEPKPEDRQDVLAVLACLGAPWSYLSTREHNEFEAPAGPPFAAVLELLKSLDVVKLGRTKKDGNRTVTVL